jgi:ribonuclease D
VTLITTTSELALACQRFSRHPFVAVDTEFLRETTFWPQLCVVQVASSDEALAIDALAPGLDLAPLVALMADQNVVKVFHAARQDVEIFWKLAGLVPSPMFDTQVAAMVCGYGDQVSYGELARSICHATVDKSSRFTDWARRPLASAQIDYAIGDVTHLRDIYRALLAQLEKSGRLSWLEDEMKVLTSPATYEQHPERAWERFKTRARKPRDLAVLMDLAAWRESEAQSRDVPRARVLKDDALIEVAHAAPRTREALANLRAFPRGMERSRAGDEILAAVERGLARDPKTLPKLERARRNGAASAATVELLKVLLRQISDESGVAGKMIATVDDLEAIAGDDDADVPALRGWRRKLFGARALELKRGKLALTVENGRVLALEWREAEAAPAPVPSPLTEEGGGRSRPAEGSSSEARRLGAASS